MSEKLGTDVPEPRQDPAVRSATTGKGGSCEMTVQGPGSIRWVYGLRLRILVLYHRGGEPRAGGPCAVITSHPAPLAPFPAAAARAAFALAAALAFLSAWRPPVSSDACFMVWDWLPVSFET